MVMNSSDDTIGQLHQDALDDLMMAVELAPTSAKYIHSIGLAHQQVGDDNLCLMRTISNQVVLFLVQMGNTDLALKFFEKALSLDGKHVRDLETHPSHFPLILWLVR